jgi:hypothetical protein
MVSANMFKRNLLEEQEQMRAATSGGNMRKQAKPNKQGGYMPPEEMPL